MCFRFVTAKDIRNLGLAILTPLFILMVAFAVLAYADIFVISSKGIYRSKVDQGIPGGWERLDKKGDVIISDLPDTPEDPDEPEDPPTTLRGRVSQAVRKANDPTNAGALRDIYALATTLVDQGLPLKSGLDLIIQGQIKVLDTVAERDAWSQYLTITDTVLKGNPVKYEDVKQIHLGLVDSTERGPAMLPSWLSMRGVSPVDYVNWALANRTPKQLAIEAQFGLGATRGH